MIHSTETIKKIYQLYFEEGMSGCKIARNLGVPKATVYDWIAKFAEQRTKANPEMKKEKPQTLNIEQVSRPEAAEIRRLKLELAEAKREIAYQKLRADAYDEMINVAESKFNIAIRKKAGAKQ